jgi:hypothetical protein
MRISPPSPKSCTGLGAIQKGEERSLIIFLGMVSKQQKKIENIIFPRNVA